EEHHAADKADQRADHRPGVRVQRQLGQRRHDRVEHPIGVLTEGEQIHATRTLSKFRPKIAYRPRTATRVLRSAAMNWSICALVIDSGGCRRSTLPCCPETVISIPASWRRSL